MCVGTAIIFCMHIRGVKYREAKLVGSKLGFKTRQFSSMAHACNQKAVLKDALEQIPFEWLAFYPMSGLSNFLKFLEFLLLSNPSRSS